MKRRNEAIMILRCAADRWLNGDMAGVWSTGGLLEASDGARQDANDAVYFTMCQEGAPWLPYLYLEAAALLEDGTLH